jgi:hypothetical protein
MDGETRILDAAAQIINGSMMVPLRFVGEALGCAVDWNETTNSVHMSALEKMPVRSDRPLTNSIADDMTSFDKAVMRSNNWTLHKDPNNPDVNIKGRIYRNSGATEYIQYALSEDVKSFQIKVYAQDGKTGGDTFCVYLSTDGEEWISVPVEEYGKVYSTAKEGYIWADLGNKEILSKGYREIRIECIGADRYFPQIASVIVN